MVGRSYNHTTDYAGKTSLSCARAYACNPWEQRTGRQLKNGELTLTEFKKYDDFGRMAEIKSGGKVIKYVYNDKNQLSSQIVDNIPIEFTYTKYGQLESKTLGGRLAPISSLKYIYAKDGMIAGRVVDGKFQMYSYDKKGQLLRVADMQGKVAEQYAYDPAGNILEKNINGKVTTYTYDKANQLVTSVIDGKTTNYAYDAAGRLVKEGEKSYTYGWLDKILNVQEQGKMVAAFDYHVDGQIARATHGDKGESFLWDGLALIHRGDNAYINEPYVTGGNPILSSKDGVMFNDMLGNTLGVKGENYSSVNMTAFGETSDKSAMFTGKPYIGELGYAFLFRNYRADQGKWQTADPLDYPDGWNNFTYVNNGVTMAIDWLGGQIIEDGGIPDARSGSTGAITWYNGVNYSSYGYFTSISYSWTEIGHRSGDGKATLSVGTYNARAITNSQAVSYGNSLSTTLSSQLSTKIGLPSAAEIGANVGGQLTSQISNSATYSIATTTTVAMSDNYSIDIPEDCKGDIIIYQLLCSISYNYKYIPPSATGENIPPIQSGNIFSVTIPMNDIHFRKIITE